MYLDPLMVEMYLDVHRAAGSQWPEDLAGKASAAVYGTSDADPNVMAGRRSSDDRAAAVEAFSVIARDEGVDDAVRVEAAERLSALDGQLAAQVLGEIARDDGVGDTLRYAAALKLQVLDQAMAVAALRDLAAGEGISDVIRMQAAELLHGRGERRGAGIAATR